MSLLDVGTVSAIASPTNSEISSFHMVSSVETSQPPQTTYDSDDEIVWSVSETEVVAMSGSEHSDEFVLLSRPQSALAGRDHTALKPVEDNVPDVIPTPATVTRSLVLEMQKLSIGENSPKVAEVQTLAMPPTTPKKQKKKKKGRTAESYPTSPVKGTATVQPPATIHVAPSPSKKKQKKKQKAAAAAGPSTSTGLGSRKVVDDVSDRQSLSMESDSVTEPSTEWQEAATFISSYLSNPAAQASAVCRLTLLQSIIIELGLGASSTLPVSLTAAKVFLKSRAFLNIREYLAVRGQGPKAVQGLLFPSRSALIKDIRKKRNPASLKWVKKHGLQVLLVGWMS